MEPLNMADFYRADKDLSKKRDELEHAIDPEVISMIQNEIDQLEDRMDRIVESVNISEG